MEKKKVYVVFGDGGSYIEKIFSSKEKAEEYIKNDEDACQDREEYNCSWDEYFTINSCCETYMNYREYYLD